MLGIEWEHLPRWLKAELGQVQAGLTILGFPLSVDCLGTWLKCYMQITSVLGVTGAALQRYAVKKISVDLGASQWRGNGAVFCHSVPGGGSQKLVTQFVAGGIGLPVDRLALLLRISFSVRLESVQCLVSQ